MSISKEKEQEIIALYQSGLSMAKIGMEINCSASTVMRILHKNSTSVRTNGGIVPLPKEEIIKKYIIQKRTLESISKDYNVTINTIKKILLDNGYNIRTSSESKNPYFKNDYFHTIDTEEKAYFLGLLLTDGCVLDKKPENGNPNHKICLELESTDKYILEKLREELGLNREVYDSERLKNGKIYKTSLLNWCSNEMAQDLKVFGVVPRKTKTVQMPILKEELMPHLIRGMIDGDGSLTFITTNGKKHLVVYFCGNEYCVSQLKDYLVNKLNVYNVKVIQRKSKSLYQVSWGSQKDVQNICNYLYSNANIYLKRKFQKFQTFLKS